MEYLIFAAGVIIGLLIRDIKVAGIDRWEEIKESRENKGKAQFFEPMGAKEAYENSQNIDEFLNKLK